jgi:dienelactone hydrolase
MRRPILALAFLLFAAIGTARGSVPFHTPAPATLLVQCGAGITTLPVTWHFPARPPVGLVWLQHGFFRTNQNIADLASKLAYAGFVVVAPTIQSLGSTCTFNNVTTFVPNFADLFGHLNDPGSELLASARAAASSVGLAVAALPARFVFSGHSAGGAAVTLAAKEYVTRFPSIAARLRGVVLLDPVENLAQSMASSLPWLFEVPILTISAAPTACNANTSGTRALLGLGRPFIGVEITTGSHCDAEGLTGSPFLCGLLCGRVQAVNILLTHIFAAGWTSDLLLDRLTATVYPGGDFYGAVAAAGLIRTY